MTSRKRGKLSGEERSLMALARTILAPWADSDEADTQAITRELLTGLDAKAREGNEVAKRFGPMARWDYARRLATEAVKPQRDIVYQPAGGGDKVRARMPARHGVTKRDPQGASVGQQQVLFLVMTRQQFQELHTRDQMQRGKYEERVIIEDLINTAWRLIPDAPNVGEVIRRAKIAVTEEQLERLFESLG